MTQMDLAVAIGLESSSMISMHERERKFMGLANVVSSAAALNVSVDYLVGLSEDPRSCSILAAELGQMDAVRNELGDLSDFSESARYVEVHEVEAAAGIGRLIDGAVPRGRVVFQRDWLASHGIDPKSCTVIVVSGDSMEPTLPDGCSILVDHNRCVRQHGHIYVLQVEDELLVKRAEGSNRKGWEMVSDNRYWPPAPWPADAVIKGEVRWSARTF